MTINIKYIFHTNKLLVRFFYFVWIDSYRKKENIKDKELYLNITEYALEIMCGFDMFNSRFIDKTFIDIKKYIKFNLIIMNL